VVGNLVLVPHIVDSVVQLFLQFFLSRPQPEAFLIQFTDVLHHLISLVKEIFLGNHQFFFFLVIFLNLRRVT
jgi:hypothetical protein